jgi:hypothetical protein
MSIILSFLGELFVDLIIVSLMESIRTFLFHRRDQPEPNATFRRRLNRRPVGVR